MKNEVLPLKPLKYAIYARKSTEGNERQARSIKDQITECKELAERNGLLVIGEPIEERKSAKLAKKRPAFAELIKRVRRGEIDGIISWHPDRLSRNLLEGGVILDLLTSGKLADLKFCSLPFSNDPSGRMMLGLMFVLASHYSDDLSQKAKRGVRRKFAEGGLGGYHKLGYVDDDGYYTPDTENNNFGLIQEAWNMRAEGKTLEEIATHLNNHNYSQIRGDKRSVRVIDGNTLSRMFTGKGSSFYFGIAVQAGQEVDLREVRPDFKPITDEYTYAKVQDVSKKNMRGGDKKREYFLPCRDIVFCDCGDERPMTVYRSKSRSGKYYIWFKCKNKECKHRPKDVRGKVLMEATGKTLTLVASRLTEDAYAKYLEESKELTSASKTTLRSENTSLTARIKWLEKENKDNGKILAEVSDERMKDSLQIGISENLNQIDKHRAKIKENTDRLTQTSTKTYTQKEFNKLVQEMSVRFKHGNVVQKDIIIRNVFLNLRFDGKKITNAILKEPFATLLKHDLISLGWG